MNKFASDLRSAETLIEILIAVSVLMIALAPAAGLRVKATQNSAYNRDHLVAEMLANNGIEIINNIRDTNLLRFSTKQNSCWNTKPEHKDIDTCDEPNNLIKTGSYIVKENIGSADIELILKDPNPLPDDFNPADDSIYRLKLDSLTETYNYDTGDSTNFYKEIYIKYSKSGKTMFVSSRVFFKNGAKIKNVTRLTALTSKAEK